MGAGYHGGFGNTRGEKDKLRQEFNETFIATELYYDANKYENYLLNEKNTKGNSKANFLKEVLGYKSGDGPILHKNLVQAITGIPPYEITKSEYGLRARFITKLKGNNGKYYNANIVVVIQKDNGKTYYRPITVYPRKKDGNK